jgi:Tol biopolymer transport system component
MGASNEPQKDIQMGNTLGNVINLSYAGKNGDWVYYLALSDIKVPWKKVFCGENLNNGKRVKISEEFNEGSIININLYSDWIYYCLTDPDGNTPLYRIKPDGSNKTLISSDNCYFVNIIDGKIFFINFSDGNKIYKMNLDGSGKESINDEKSWSLNVVNGWIYFTNEKGICKIPIQGGPEVVISKEPFGTTAIVNDDWVYYIQGEQGKIYQINTDGSKKACIVDKKVDRINISENKIYYSMRSGEKYYIYQVDLNGKNNRKIGEGLVGGVVGDWIYTYDTYEEWDVPQRIKKDGTSRKILSLK